MNNLRQALNNPDVNKDLKEWGEGVLNNLFSHLEKATDPVQVYRVQGQITAIKRVIALRSELNGGA